jgi:hypothetical protein
MYYDPPPEKRPSGCLETLIVTRAVFGVLFWPIVALGILLVLFVAAFVLSAVHPALILVPVAAAVLGLALVARWERRRFRPPGL